MTDGNSGHGADIARRGLLAAAGGAFAIGSSQAQAQMPDASQAISDELALRRIVALVDMAVDARDWPAARAWFAEMARVDFSTLAGGEPTTVPADALVASWAGNLRGDKTSLHIRGETLVDIAGESATLRSNGYAWNRKPGGPDGDLWEVWGQYVHELVRTPQGWRIVGFAFRALYQRGSAWVRDTPGA
ncbi:MAG: nuclear transport factor 2 family protein [Alphaproteobacteria bacterium]|nr:nuclear transport factor 2 family protein [Alphaproteobacteria bacterium]